MAIRRNLTTLTSTEKQDFIRAVRALKNNNRSGNRYNQYIRWHIDAAARATPSNISPSIRNAAHNGPAFLPWHREFLRRFELDLQRIVPGIGLPYWDWTADAALTNPATAPIWAADFMGGNGNPNNNDVVTTGPFRYLSTTPVWIVVDRNGSPLRYSNGSATGALKRRFGSGGTLLPNPAQVSDAIDEEAYDDDPWDGSTQADPSHRNTLEGQVPLNPNKHLHNRVHRWVSGTMLSSGSPNDPVFFLHHCNIDRLWAQWQAQNPDIGYLPISGGPPGHNLRDRMFPWDGEVTPVTPASVLDHTALGYSYDTDVLL